MTRIYFGSFKFFAPLCDGVEKNLSPLLDEYWKRNGFFINVPINQLKDLIRTDSFKYEVRKASPRKGANTLSDFKEITSPGDHQATFLFSVVTKDKRTLEKVTSDASKIFSRYVVEKLKKEELRYQLMHPQKVSCRFVGDWGEIIDRVPYIDKLYPILSRNGVRQIF